MKRKGLLIIGIILIILGISLFILKEKDEDSWIKDSRGVWIKHGVPEKTPDYVLEQQSMINCSLKIFENFTGTPDSQCLGICGNYSVDLVHVPRTAADDLAENQCAEYINGTTSHFIELDKEANIIRIV